MITLRLPFPPSVWDLYYGNGHRTTRYKDWVKEAGLMILATPIGQRQPIKGPYSMVLLLGNARRWTKAGKRRVIDATNFIKAPEDLLVRHTLLEDDNLAEHMAVTWSDKLTRDACEVRVWPWDDERAAIRALSAEGEAA